MDAIGAPLVIPRLQRRARIPLVASLIRRTLVKGGDFHAPIPAESRAAASVFAGESFPLLHALEGAIGVVADEVCSPRGLQYKIKAGRRGKEGVAKRSSRPVRSGRPSSGEAARRPGARSDSNAHSAPLHRRVQCADSRRQSSRGGDGNSSARSDAPDAPLPFLRRAVGLAGEGGVALASL